jgi:hypothetical protein
MMSTLRCSCGHAIQDVSIHRRHGDVFSAINDQDGVFSEAAARIAAFFAADTAGSRAEWLAEAGMGYAQRLSDENVIHDILAAWWLERVLRVSECGGCGRLWIQEQPKTSRYVAFSPDWRGMRSVLQSPIAREKESQTSALP